MVNICQSLIHISTYRQATSLTGKTACKKKREKNEDKRRGVEMSGLAPKRPDRKSYTGSIVIRCSATLVNAWVVWLDSSVLYVCAWR